MMKPEEVLIILVGIAIVINVTVLDDLLLFYDNLQLSFENFKGSLILIFYSFLAFAFSWKGLIALVIVAIPFILYLNYRLNMNFSEYLAKRRGKIQRFEEEKEAIESLLKTKIKGLNLEELSSFIDSLNKKLNLINNEFKKLRIYREPLLEKEQRSLKRLKVLKRKRVLEKYREQKEKLEQRNKEIREENQKLLEERENKNWHILRRLNADRTNVFLKDELSQEEIDALREDGFEETNEYDVRERRVIPVLVKKIMNHNSTHTFLVWSIQQLLQDMELDDVEVHDTKYPDLTFTYNKGEFAIEVECGSLLRKKKQMNDKIKFLNKNFQDRWLIVVSNKNLLSQYRKYGFTTQRSEVEKTMEKWLNSDI